METGDYIGSEVKTLQCYRSRLEKWTKQAVVGRWPLIDGYN